jgi:hypothetical protein
MEQSKRQALFVAAVLRPEAVRPSSRHPLSCLGRVRVYGEGVEGQPEALWAEILPSAQADAKKLRARFERRYPGSRLLRMEWMVKGEGPARAKQMPLF